MGLIRRYLHAHAHVLVLIALFAGVSAGVTLRQR
jgi:hypothetical protein